MHCLKKRTNFFGAPYEIKSLMFFYKNKSVHSWFFNVQWLCTLQFASVFISFKAPVLILDVNAGFCLNLNNGWWMYCPCYQRFSHHKWGWTLCHKRRVFTGKNMGPKNISVLKSWICSKNYELGQMCKIYLLSHNRWSSVW